MSGIRVLVIRDNNGHYNGAPLNDRRRVIKVLKDIEDGEYYPDILQYKKLEDKDPWSYDLEEWDDFVNKFTQRGTCEIIKI